MTNDDDPKIGQSKVIGAEDALLGARRNAYK